MNVQPMASTLAFALLLQGCATSVAVTPVETPAIDTAPLLGPARTPADGKRLGNGLRIADFPTHTGWFEAALLFSGGPLLDPPERPGLTDWLVETALMGTDGDPNETTPPFGRALALGVTLLPVSQGDLFGWAIYGPQETRTEALQLLADIAMRPTFPATSMQVRGARERQRIEAQGDEELRTLIAVAAGHALGLARPLRLEPAASLFDAVLREDVVRHWRRWVRPEHAVLVTTQSGAIGRSWSAWTNDSALPASAKPCVPHGQSTHLIISGEEVGDDVLVVLAVPVPGRGTEAHAGLTAWLRWLGEEPWGPIMQLVGEEQARRATPSLVELATRPGTSVAVAIAGTRGSPEEALSDLELVSYRLHAPLEKDNEDGLRGGMQSLRAERIIRYEKPLARLILAGKEALHGSSLDFGGPDAASAEARRVLSPWRYTFAGLGTASFETALQDIAPVTRWDASGQMLEHVPARRCEHGQTVD